MKEKRLRRRGDKVEYPSKYDFYLKFKPVYNKEGYFWVMS